jgi:hypothetical protein
MTRKTLDFPVGRSESQCGFTMGLTAEQLQMAGLIDARVKAIAKSGVDDLAIFTDMADYLPAFKRLMDTSTADDMDLLAARYTGFYQYAKILEAVAAGIRSGKIVVPK